MIVMLSNEERLERYHVKEYPRSSKFDPEWVQKNEMGPNVLWLTESLTQVLELKPGMRVLHLGCGKAMSSIFLAKEFDVQVWATDLWIDASDNLLRIRDAGLEDKVFPIHAEAHALPKGWELWVRWNEFLLSGSTVNKHNTEEDRKRILADGGRFLGFIQMVATKK